MHLLFMKLCTYAHESINISILEQYEFYNISNNFSVLILGAKKAIYRTIISSIVMNELIYSLLRENPVRHNRENKWLQCNMIKFYI
jgi:hypothetical protein